MHYSRPLTILLCLIGVACGDDAGPDDTSLPCPPTHYSCDIAQQDCAAGILDLTACVRGDAVPELPKINRLTAREFGEQLRRDAMEDGIGASPWDPVLRALGLVPQGKSLQDAAIAEAVDSVAAFYDTETKEVSIITDAGSERADPLERMYVLSHEFTHLLQDKAHDLQKLDDAASESTDRKMALGMLVEGEAVVNSTRALLRLVRRSPDDFDFSGFFDTLDDSLSEGILSTSSPLAATLQSLPYSVGGRYVAQVWSQRGRPAVDHLFESAPLTAADWMALETSEEAPSQALRLACAPPLPPQGFELHALDHLGAAGVVALLGSIDMVDSELAQQLADDAFALYVAEGAADPASAEVIGVWRLRFRSSSAQERFYELFKDHGIGLRRTQSELVIRVSSDGARALLQGTELEACPSLAELEPKHDASSTPIAALKRLWH